MIWRKKNYFNYVNFTLRYYKAKTRDRIENSYPPTFSVHVAYDFAARATSYLGAFWTNYIGSNISTTGNRFGQTEIEHLPKSSFIKKIAHYRLAR